MDGVTHILFDLDGTLTDPKLGITSSIRHALQAMDAPVPEPEELTWCIGPPLRGSFARLLGRSDEVSVERAMAFYRERFSASGMFENTVYDGIDNALGGIRAGGARLFLATSKPLFFAEQILRHFALDGHFDGAYGSEMDGGLSDKAELVAHLLRRESIPSAAAIMVGDREHDVLGAKANGLRAIGVSYGYGTREELIAAGAAHVVDSPAALLELLSPGAGVARV